MGPLTVLPLLSFSFCDVINRFHGQTNTNTSATTTGNTVAFTIYVFSHFLFQLPMFLLPDVSIAWDCYIYHCCLFQPFVNHHNVSSVSHRHSISRILAWSFSTTFRGSILTLGVSSQYSVQMFLYADSVTRLWHSQSAMSIYIFINILFFYFTWHLVPLSYTWHKASAPGSIAVLYLIQISFVHTHLHRVCVAMGRNIWRWRQNEGVAQRIYYPVPSANENRGNHLCVTPSKTWEMDNSNSRPDPKEEV